MSYGKRERGTSLALMDISMNGKLQIRGAGAADLLRRVFGDTPPASRSMDVREDIPEQGRGGDIQPVNFKLLRLVEDEFILLTPPGRQADMEGRMRAELQSQEAFTSIIDLTSGLAGFLLAGGHGHSALSKLCALPLGTDQFPNRCLAQTGLAKVWAILLRNDLSQVPAFEIYFDRSYREFLWEVLLEAGEQFGLRSLGREALGELGDWRS